MRDYAYEALAEVTSTDMTVGRGELNAALKSIRDQADIPDSYLLADEIHARAKMYREAMPEVMLTPSALAKHWLRVYEEAQKKPPLRTNQAAPATACPTCGGDRFVVYSLRKPVQSQWMKDRGIEPSEDMIEEMAPCPDCNAKVNTEFYRVDGTTARSPDAGQVRDRLSRHE